MGKAERRGGEGKREMSDLLKEEESPWPPGKNAEELSPSVVPCRESGAVIRPSPIKKSGEGNDGSFTAGEREGKEVFHGEEKKGESMTESLQKKCSTTFHRGEKETRRHPC